MCVVLQKQKSTIFIVSFLFFFATTTNKSNNLNIVPQDAATHQVSRKALKKRVTKLIQLITNLLAMPQQLGQVPNQAIRTKTLLQIIKSKLLKLATVTLTQTILILLLIVITLAKHQQQQQKQPTTIQMKLIQKQLQRVQIKMQIIQTVQ